MNQVNRQSEVFKTKDTPLAAFLVTEGFTVLDVIFEGKIAFFLFANDCDKFHQCINDFQTLKATTNASQLIYNYQGLVKRTKRGF